MNDRNNSITTIEKICLVYLLAWSISPPLQLDLIYRIVTLLCAVVIFFSHRSVLSSREIAMPFLFIGLIIVIAFAENPSLSGVLNPISFYMLYIAYVAFFFYKDSDDDLRPILLIAILLFIVFNIITIREVTINPRITRAIVRDDPLTYSYYRKGVGGYGLVYSQVCIFPVALSWVLSERKRSMPVFVFGIIYIVSFVVLILKAGYTIAIVGTSLGTICYFFYKGKRLLPIAVVSLLIVGAVLLLINYSIPFRNVLLTIFNGTKVAAKINDLVSTAETGQTAVSISDRIDAYGASIGTILRYPITGGLFWAGGGGHSALLDTFAKYGIFGILMYVRMSFSVYRTYKQDEVVGKTVMAGALSSLTVLLLDAAPYNLMMPLVVLQLIMLKNIQQNSKRNLGG